MPLVGFEPTIAAFKREETSCSLWKASVKEGSVPSEIRTGYLPNTILELFQENYFYDVSELYSSLGFEGLTAVGMNVPIFWDIGPCGPYVNWRFGGTYNLHLQGKKSAEQETKVKPVAGPANDSVHSGTIVKLKSRIVCRGQSGCCLETPWGTPRSRILHKEPPVAQLLNNSPKCYRTLRFVAVIAKAFHWSLF
jgi:hypothetical protein